MARNIENLSPEEMIELLVLIKDQAESAKDGESSGNAIIDILDAFSEFGIPVKAFDESDDEEEEE